MCSPGYYFSSGSFSCKECDNFKPNPFSLIFILIIIGGIVVVLFCGAKSKKSKGEAMPNKTADDYINEVLTKVGILKQNMTQLELKHLQAARWSRLALVRAKLKLYITLYQIIVSAPYVLDLTFPTIYTEMTSVFSILAFNVMQESGASCSGHSIDYVDYLIFTTLAPIVVTLFIWVTALLHVLYYQLTNTDVNEADKLNEFYAIKTLYFSIFLVFTYLVLPGVSIAIFRTFGCTDADPDDAVSGNNIYMQADYSISCTSDRYDLGKSWAIAMLFVYPIGVPLYYFYILYNARLEIMNRDSSGSGTYFDSKSGSINSRTVHKLEPLKFLYSVYKPEYWFWEIIETFQRLLFTGILSVISQGTSLQILVAMLFACIFIKLYHMYNPWVSESVTATKHMIQWQIYFLFLFALMARNDILSDNYLLLVMCLVLLIFLNLFVEVWQLIIPIFRHWLKFRSFRNLATDVKKSKAQQLSLELLCAKQAQEKAISEVEKLQAELNTLKSILTASVALDDDVGISIAEIKSPLA